MNTIVRFRHACATSILYADGLRGGLGGQSLPHQIRPLLFLEGNGDICGSITYSQLSLGPSLQRAIQASWKMECG